MPFVSINRWFRKSRRNSNRQTVTLLFEPLDVRDVPATLVNRNADVTKVTNAAAEVLGTSQDGRYLIFSSKATDIVTGQVDVPNTKDLFWVDTFSGDLRLVTSLPTLLTENGQTKYNVSQTVTSFSSELDEDDMFTQAVISGDGKSVAFTSKINASRVDTAMIRRVDAIRSGLTGDDVTRTNTPDRGNTTDDVFLWTSNTRDIRTVSRTFQTNEAGGTRNNFAFGFTSVTSDPAISFDGTLVSFVSAQNAENVLPFQLLPDPFASQADRNLASLLVRDGDGTNDVFFTNMQRDAVDVGINSYRTGVVTSYRAADDLFRIITGQDKNGVITTELQAFRRYNTYGSNNGVQITTDPLGRYMANDGTTYTVVSNLNPAALNQFDASLVQYTPFNGGSNVFRIRVGVGNSGVNGNANQVVSTTKQVGAKFNTISNSGLAAGNAIIARAEESAILYTVTGGAFTSAELFQQTIVGSVSTDAVVVSAIGDDPLAGTGNGVLAVLPDGKTTDPRGYQISPNGSAAVFTSTSSNLVSKISDSNKANDVFFRNLNDNTLTLVSVTVNGRSTGNKASQNPQLSSDDRLVAFDSLATNLTNVTDTNNGSDVFLRDLAAASTAAVSTIASGANTGDAKSTLPQLGGLVTNGRISFNSFATNIDTRFVINPGQQNIFTNGIPLIPGTAGVPNKSPRVGVASGGELVGAGASFVQFGSNSETLIGTKFNPFPGFTGELRVTTALVSIAEDDVLPDMVIATGPGISNRVVVVDGTTGSTLRNFAPFEASFTGGLTVAAADFNLDGIDDIAVSADIGGGPRIKIVNGANGSTLADFFAFEPSFRGGSRLATAFIGEISDTTGKISTNGVGVADLVVGAGIGGGPRVSVFDGRFLSKNQPRRLSDFFAFEQSLRNGVNVAGGDISRDNIDDVVVGAGPGGGPRVTTFDAVSLIVTPDSPRPIANFFAFDSSIRDGVRVTVKNIDNDQNPDYLVGLGAGGLSRVRTYSGRSPVQDDVVFPVNPPLPVLIDDTVLYNDFGSTNGAWVG